MLNTDMSRDDRVPQNAVVTAGPVFVSKTGLALSMYTLAEALRAQRYMNKAVLPLHITYHFCACGRKQDVKPPASAC